VIGATIFLSAFLLFLVQPIIAKLILPRFGGGVAVWATCLVFFQLALLLGYLYAHAIVRCDRHGRWRAAHIALLSASLLALPIVPRADGPALAGLGPSVQVIALLVVTIGLPFVLLATTSPLLQAWLAGGLATQRAAAWRDPYRLFVISNLASLAALLAYPWGIEPWLGSAMQARVWSWLYAGYVVLAAVIAWRARAHDVRAPVQPQAASQLPRTPLGRTRVMGWIALAALASYELVAVTNHLTQNIPSMPLMWVLPLVAYLLTFTLCFDGERWYRPRLFRGATLIAVVAMCWLLSDSAMANRLALQGTVFVIGLFVICMHCHGELARDRPPARQLTMFYLCVAAGGALGGALVGLAAPALLPGYFEVEIGLVLVMLAVLWRSSQRSRVWATACATVAVCAAATAAFRYDRATGDVVAMQRNFYGVLRVQEYGGKSAGNELERTLVHGSILHGQQFLGDSRRTPTSYYVETSGIGRVLTALDDRPLQVGVVGLGAGTLAAYGKAGDRYRFYEINPAVADIARRYFTFLADSAAQVDVAIGDGRLLLQRPGEPRFDVLAIDAFSGDSIPVHLLTREAVALFFERLLPHGVLALHVSNRHLDLRPVVARIAADRGLQLAYVEDKVEQGDGEQKSSSDWILLARDRAVLDLDLVRDGSSELPDRAPALRLWSDDYSNIVQVMSLTRPITH
jgi:hypothetical protein